MQAVVGWLWRLLPGNPMVIRIVSGGSRRLRHLWVRMGYLGALLLLLFFGLLFGGGMATDVSLTDLAKAGAGVFAFIAYAQVVLVCLIAPLFMAGAIQSEQSGETMDILLTTPLSNLQIVLGSLGGRMFFVLTLLLSGLPLFSVLLIFGGVTIRSVFVAFAVAGLTAIMVGAVAVALSVFRIGGRKAVFAFVIGIAAYLVAAYALDVVVLRNLSGAAAGTTTWLTPLHPLLVLEASINTANYTPPSDEMVAHLPRLVGWYLSRPLGAFAVLTMSLTSVLILASAVMLRRIGQGESKWLHAIRSKLRLGDGNRERAGREVWSNPIAWREANTRGNAAAGILARWGFVFIGLLAAAVLLLFYHTGHLPTLGGGMGARQPYEVFQSAIVVLLLLEVAVVVLVAIYMSAGCVSREREDGTLDLILATPVTPRQYIWGKLRGLVSFLSHLIALPVLTVAMVSGYALIGSALGWPTAKFMVYTLASSSGPQIQYQAPLMLPEAAVLLVLMLVPFVALCVASGMSWSLKARGVLGAVIPTIAVLGVAVLVLGLCGWNAAENVQVVGPIINAFSPVTNLFMIVDPWRRAAGFDSHPTAGRIALGVGALLVAGGYSLIVWGMVVGMIKGFDHTVRRLSGTG